MLKVLVIEDNLGDAQLIRVWLGFEAPGAYHLSRVGSLAEALDSLDRQAFDVVLADLSLPDAHGLDTVRGLDGHLGESALIVLSGNEDENTAIGTMRAGGQDFLVKGHVDGFLLRRSIHYAVERRRLEMALEDSQARFRNFANASCDWFWETDADHRFTYLSDTFQRVTGIEPGLLLGHTRLELMKDKALPFWQQHQETLTAHQPFQDLEYWIDLIPGTARCFRVGGVPVFGRRKEFKGYQGVGRDITERREMEERIARMALVDTLTGLPNRPAFEDALQRTAALSKRHGSTTAILYLDLDGFKAVNDTMGHGAGDDVLREVAARLKACLRSEDMIARLGGDEFAALVPVALDNACREAAAAADRIIDMLSRPMETCGGLASIGASVGIVIHPLCCRSIADCLHDADDAMYVAKRAGKGRHACPGGECRTTCNLADSAQ